MGGRKPKSTQESNDEEVNNLGFIEVIEEVKGLVSPIVGKRPVNQQEFHKFVKLLRKLVDLQLGAVEKHADIQDKFIKLQNEKTEVQARVKSYADCLSRNSDGLQERFRNASNKKRETLILIPNSEDKGKENPKTVKTSLMKLLCPRESRISVDSCVVMKNGRVKLQLPNTEHLDRALQLIDTKRAEGFQYIAKRKTKLLPVIRIQHIDKDLNANELFDCLCSQNECIENAIKSGEEMKILFPIPSRSDLSNSWVIRVSPKLRYLLKKNRTVYVGLHSSPVLDHVGIRQCFNCCKFGHVASNCVPKHPACSHCGEEDHNFKNCKNKNNNACIKCINCIRWSQYSKNQNCEFHHKASDPNCPRMIAVKQKLIENTNYDEYGY
ncbi:uncharacterized protein LOC111637145 [Centruroides sculpturatus]|uniref:uncharacterized protein LOC111637145 n=1 Tax=Centruroides sculpturatus TaxID=218467 RepID=UPI000C6DCB0A|nr:uncharacterized protein LOC111637145 [Centruroides sculpturatus]